MGTQIIIVEKGGERRKRERKRETEKLLSGRGNQQPLGPGIREAKREIV